MSTDLTVCGAVDLVATNSIGSDNVIVPQDISHETTVDFKLQLNVFGQDVNTYIIKTHTSNPSRDRNAFVGDVALVCARHKSKVKFPWKISRITSAAI